MPSSPTKRITIDEAPDMMTTRHLSQVSGLSEHTLHMYRQQGGKGPRYVKIGGWAVRYHKADVIAWLEANTFHNTSQYDTTPGTPRRCVTPPAPSTSVTSTVGK